MHDDLSSPLSPFNIATRTPLSVPATTGDLNGLPVPHDEYRAFPYPLSRQ